MEEHINGFMNTVDNFYGEVIKENIKTYMILNKRLANMNSRKQFLINCRRSGIFPNHITNSLKFLLELIEYNSPFNNRVNNLMTSFKTKVLNIEISVTIWKIQMTYSDLKNVKYRIKQFLHETDYTNFIRTQNQRYNRILLESNNITSKKFREIHRMMNNGNICSNNENDHNNNLETCVNISGTRIPNNIKEFIGLGNNFALPYYNTVDVPFYNIIADTENIIKGVEDHHTQNIMRCKTVNILQNFIRQGIRSNNYDRKLNSLEKETKEFLKDNKENIIIVKADKGNKSVIMDRVQYSDKIEALLSDNNTYKLEVRDPTNSMETHNNLLVKQLYEKGFIDLNTKKYLTTYTSIAPKFYGLPKLHKENVPIRPIVSFVNAPTYNLSKFLAKIINEATTIENEKYNIRNSYELVNTITNILVPDNYILISLDVTSLFTKISIGEAIASVNKRWHLIQPLTEIPQHDFINLITFCFKSGYFSYNGQFFTQIDGIAMGSTLSPDIANIVMNDLIEAVLESIDFQIYYIKKYVDDLLLCIPKEKKEVVLNAFNSYNHHLQFTIEIENNMTIPYLDVLLIRNSNGTIVTQWYQKSIASGRILNFNSCHPISQKISAAYGLIFRIKKLTTDDNFNTNKLIYEYLRKNNYPNNIISKLIFKYNLNIATSRLHGQQSETVYKSLTYTRGLSEKINNALKSHLSNTRISFRVNNTIRKYFTNLKDQTDVFKKSNVVYSIPCGTCDQQYIGTTSQKLSKRISGHRSNSKVPIINPQISSLTQHCYDTGHKFRFEDTKILSRESNWNKRLFLEMLQIQAHKSSTVNKRADVENLSQIYIWIIENISNLNNR